MADNIVWLAIMDKLRAAGMPFNASQLKNYDFAKFGINVLSIHMMAPVVTVLHTRRMKDGIRKKQAQFDLTEPDSAEALIEWVTEAYEKAQSRRRSKGPSTADRGTN